MADLNYPDYFYADAQKQSPTHAYRAPPETSELVELLAQANVCRAHLDELISRVQRLASKTPREMYAEKEVADTAPAGRVAHETRYGRPTTYPPNVIQQRRVVIPNCDGLYPLAHVAIQMRDELHGPESRL